MSETTQTVDTQFREPGSEGRELRILFVTGAATNGAALIAFNDPAPCHAAVADTAPDHAVRTESESAADEFLRVLLLPSATPPPSPSSDDAARTIFLKYRGVELTWRPGYATLQCDPGQAETLLPALAEFAHYERELRRIESEIAAGWTDLAQDKALAFEIAPADLQRTDAVGSRMNNAFGRRIRYARIEPHLYEPGATLSAAGQKLGAELREKARIESRLETIDAQLEVYEHIYELGSQRLGEYRAAREEHVLEWIIIVLLAAELLALLAQMLLKH
ncbi:MAG: hypothetical protein M3O31_08385 [Acidobacteriota bacterium]|nr:hypothetical protein [Acidobacteriota bacterium]